MATSRQISHVRTVYYKRRTIMKLVGEFLAYSFLLSIVGPRHIRLPPFRLGLTITSSIVSIPSRPCGSRLPNPSL